MNKNNLRRIAVFMAIMAAASPQVKTSASVMLYGGPGFWVKKPIVIENGPDNKVKKPIVIENGPDNKKFYKNPKIMVPAVAGGAAFVTGTIFLSLWGAGVIGKKEKSDEKVNNETQELKKSYVNITENIQGEEKSPFPDYWEVVEKLDSGNVCDFCTGKADYESEHDSFSVSENGIDNNHPEKLTICKKSAEDLKQYASQFEQEPYKKKWNLKTDANNGRLHINIYFNSAKTQYEFKVCSSGDKKFYKFNVKHAQIIPCDMYGGPNKY